MNTIFKKHTAIRQKPKNLYSDDLKLFEHEFSKEIRETQYLYLKYACVLKDTIFSFNKFKVYFSFCHIKKFSIKLCINRLKYFFNRSQKVNNAVWITDSISHEYFHWFTDALTRLEASKLIDNNRTIILPTHFSKYKYIKESLEILDCKYLFFEEKLKVSDLLLISHTASTGNYNKKIINDLRTKFLDFTIAEPNRKIYISRAKANKRKIINEDEIIDLLKKYNYEIHFFEDYSFAKQLRIMNETKYLIGLHGAGLTNMLFMQQGGSILELRNENDCHNNCYFSLSSDLGHKYYYQLNKGNSIDTHIVDITVDTKTLMKNLQLIDN